MEGVAEPVALGPQVLLVVRVRDGLDGHLVGDREAVALEPVDLLRIVGEDADAREPEVDEDLGPDAVVAQDGGEAELQVRVDGVEPALLELVRAELVEEADAPSLLREVEQDAAALALDHRQRRLQLLAAVAPQRMEDVA